METVKNTTFIDALLPLAMALFIIAVGVILLYQHFKKNLFAQKLKEEALKNIYQNNLLRSTIQAQEEERKRMAQDLHDELGAVLSIMRMNLMMIEEQYRETTPELWKNIRNVRALAETALSSARSVSHKLMPPQLEAFGLIKTLYSVTDQINNGGKLSVNLETPARWPEVPWPVSIGLYRVIMELISNTIRHAGASAADISLTGGDQGITCIYRDNGKGLKQEAPHKGGLGFASIDGRIATLKGKFEKGNHPAGGFFARIDIPLG